MVVYKHAHPDDYEAIQSGRSRLDAVLRLKDRLVRARIRGIDVQVSSLRNAIDTGEGVTQRAELAGE